MSGLNARGDARAFDAGPELVCCRASLRTGALLEDAPTTGSRDMLEALASTLPELFGSVDPGVLQRIAERVGVEGSDQGPGEMLLLAEGHVHLIQPLASQPGVALLAVSPLVRSLGLVLSVFHARVAALEAK